MQVLIGVSIRLSDGQIVMTSNGVVIWGSIVNSEWGYRVTVNKVIECAEFQVSSACFQCWKV